MNNYTYVTLLGSDDYFLPVYGLYYSLLQVNSKYPLTVIVLDTVSVDTIQKLEQYHIPYKVFPNLQSKARMLGIKEKEPRLKVTFAEFFQIMVMNKFYVYDLKEFDKVCFIDGDILIKQNIDFIFNYQTPAGKIREHGRIRENNGRIEAPMTLITSEYWVVNPHDYKSAEIFEKFSIFAWDELVLSALYPYEKVTNTSLILDNQYMYHAHAHGYSFRYWEYYNLITEEDIQNFYDNITSIDTDAVVMKAENLKNDFFIDFHNKIVLDSSLMFDEQQELLDQIMKDNYEQYQRFYQLIRENINSDNY